MKRPLVAYMGWLGHNNIGDEACYEEIKRRLPKNIEIITWDGHAWPRKALPKVCILGGGTIFDIRLDRRGKALYDMLCSKVPIFIWGTGVLPLKAPKRPTFSKMHPKALAVLKGAKIVGVRGPISYNNLKRNGFSSATIIGDPALLYPGPRNINGKNSNVVAINIGDAHTNLFGTEEHVLEETKKICNILKEKGLEVVLFGMWPADYKFLNKIENTTILPYDPSTYNLLEFLSGCRCVIGQKLHSCVLSAACITPFISLGYREKCFDFCSSVKLNNLIVRTDSKTLSEEVITKFNILNDSYDKIQQRLIDHKKVYNARHSKVASIVSNFIRK